MTSTIPNAVDAGVFAAGGSDVRIFDFSGEQREAARDYAAQHVDDIKQTLGVDPPRTGDVALADDLGATVRGASVMIAPESDAKPDHATIASL